MEAFPSGASPAFAQTRRTCDSVNQGQFISLLNIAKSRCACQKQRSRIEDGSEEDLATRAKQSLRQVQLGQIRRGRQALTSAALAPGNQATLEELTDDLRRPPALTAELPHGTNDFQPAAPVELDRKQFLQNTRSLARGVAADPLGTRNEHVKVMLDDENLAELWCNAACLLAKGQIPGCIRQGMAVGRMTALSKGDGRVRGIVTGNAHRRLVAKTLAQQFSDDIESATAPFQFALSTRAGTAAMSHLLRVASNIDPDLVAIAIDGVGAFDHI